MRFEYEITEELRKLLKWLPHAEGDKKREIEHKIEMIKWVLCVGAY